MPKKAVAQKCRQLKKRKLIVNIQKESTLLFENRRLTPMGIHGVGLRSVHYDYILKNFPNIGWFEALSENYMGIEGKAGGRPISILERIRDKYPIVLHGVSLSIGSCDDINLDYLASLNSLCNRIEPAWVSDHLCWTGVDGTNLHDLMPLPFTKESVSHLVRKIGQAQDILNRQLVFENVSSYFTFRSSEMNEWEFISEISSQSGCGILLDINNVFVSSVNHGFNPKDYIHGVPKSAVKQFHLAGHTNMGTHLIDTHDHPICPEVWNLYELASEYYGYVPTLVEWDDKIPDFEILYAEAKLAAEIQEKVLGNNDLSVFSIFNGNTTLASMDCNRALRST